MMNENEVTLRVDEMSNICWKGKLSQKDVIKETFYLKYIIVNKI